MAGKIEEIDGFAALARLNEGFGLVLDALDRLEQLGLIRDQPHLLEGLALTVEETRAWSNFEITSALRDHTKAKWARLGKERRSWQEKTRR